MTKSEEIGLRLKNFVEKNFDSTSELTRKLGLTRSYFIPYYSGKSILGGDTLSKLADLGCDINWLLTGKEQNNFQVREHTPAYNPQQLLKTDLINILLKANNITLQQFSQIVSLPVDNLEQYFTGRKIPHEIFTVVINAIDSNSDLFHNRLGIDFESLKRNQTDNIELNSDSPVLKYLGEERGKRVLPKFNKSPNGDYLEANIGNYTGIDSDTLKHIVLQHQEHTKMLRQQITDLKEDIKNKRQIITEQRLEIEKLKKMLTDSGAVI